MWLQSVPNALFLREGSEEEVRCQTGNKEVLNMGIRDMKVVQSVFLNPFD